MLQRLLTIALLFILLNLALRGCNPSPDSYRAMHLQHVGGRPYLVLQYTSSALEGEGPYISVYTPKDNSLEEWEPITVGRLGPADGVFEVKLQPKPADAVPEASQAPTTDPAPKGNGDTSPPPPPPEWLGLFHSRRVTLLGVSSRPMAEQYGTLPFAWRAETSVAFKGATYAFGAEWPEHVTPEQERDGVPAMLRAARFDGEKWVDLRLEGPTFKFTSPGFWLQAVALKNQIKFFWRQLDVNQVLGERVEGLRLAGSGPLYVGSFDGENFDKEVVSVPALPRGNTAVYTQEEAINVLIQTAAKPGEQRVSDPLEIRTLLPDQATKTYDAKLIETIVPEQAPRQSALLGFIAAEPFMWQKQEHIIRSNWQGFEILRKTPGQPWSVVIRNPKGLPVYDIETVLMSSMMVALGMVAFGVGLAYRRSRVAWKPGRKIQAQDIYASAGIRVGAYAVDMGLVLSVLILLTQQLGFSVVSLTEMLQFDLTRLPHPAFLGLYLLYLVGSEWLIGATPGKYIMGLRVVMDSGAKLTLWSALVRNTIGFYERLPLAAIFVPLPMMIFTPKHQRLGDLLSRSCVVHKAALDAYNLQRAAAETKTSDDLLGVESDSKDSMARSSQQKDEGAAT